MRKNISLKDLFALTVILASISITEANSQENKSFLNPPLIIKDPSTTVNYSVESRKFTGIPSLADGPEGRLWATWYAGLSPGEDRNNYVVVASSEDKGKTWREVIAIDPDGPGPVRAFDPQLWVDPESRLWVFWAQSNEKEMAVYKDGLNTGVWAMVTDNAETGNPSWSDPRRLTNGIMMCKPVILSTGEWIMPASTWQTKDGARVVVSTDKGKNWSLRGAVNVPENVWNCDEHMIVEKKDGTLWMLVRTIYGIGESFSCDKGKSWTALMPSKFQHPTSRFFIHRLNSGNILLVKHGPIEVRTGRSHLMAFISKDDGQTWSGGLLLDERTGVSYPDGQQTKDGKIYIIYDYNRTKEQLILMTNFSEEDILPCSDVKLIEVFRRRCVVNKGGQE